RDARHDVRDRARDLQGRPAARARPRCRADRARARRQRRRAAHQGGGRAPLRMSASILPLALENVSYASNGQPIISSVSLAIVAGPSTIILGANGAGKSVLMRLMHGLLAPASGTVSWRAKDRGRVRRLQALVINRPVVPRRSALPNHVCPPPRADMARREHAAHVLLEPPDVARRH